MPGYLSKVTMDVDSNTFYWASRLIGAMADANYAACIQHIERYQAAIAANGSRLVHEYDKMMMESQNYSLIAEANRKLCAMARTEATATLGKVLREGSLAMKCGYKRSDN